MKTKKTFLGLLLALAMPICAVAQNVNVKGQVLDDLGEPVIAANVIQVGNPANGTVTDLDGNYSISVPSNASLQFSFMGYVSKTEVVNGAQ